MLRRIILIPVLLAAAFAAAQESDTTYAFTTISDPHATTGTGAVRINNKGDIAGVYGTTTAALGFLDVDGTFTTILPPGAGRAKAFGINSSDEIVGYYRNCIPTTCSSKYPDIAFIYSKGKYTAVKSPSTALPSIQFIGINDSGAIVGSLLEDASADCTTTSPVCRGGFIYQGGTFTYLHPFGSSDSVATDISNSGEVVGAYYNTTAKRWEGFSYQDGKYTAINAPDSKETYVFGISPTTGEIVGVFGNSDEELEGFVDRNGEFTTIAYPDSEKSTTFVFGVNDSGDLVGDYKNSKSVIEGFLAKP
jgi:uncharacterized membrane protein